MFSFLLVKFVPYSYNFISLFGFKSSLICFDTATVSLITHFNVNDKFAGIDQESFAQLPF